MSQFQWQTRKIQPGGGAPGAGSGAGSLNRPGQLSQNVVALNELKFTLHQRLIEELDPNKLEGLGKEKAREAVEQAARTLIAQEMPGIVGTTRDELVSSVADEVLGLGPLEPLLRDPAISEIMVNHPDTVFYEKEGRLYLSSVRFRRAHRRTSGPARRRIVADGGRAPRGRLACQRDHPARGAQEPDRYDQKVPYRQNDDQRPRRDGCVDERAG
jgi:hypothetical protein